MSDAVETRSGQPIDGVSVTYQRKHIRCGKPLCRCQDGHPHGPYWYAYAWRSGDDRTVSVYVGKKLDYKKARRELSRKLKG